MKKLALFIGFCLLLQGASIAQVKDPVNWTFAALKTQYANTYDIQITAEIPAPWHIYSQTQEPGGPLPTKISFNTNPLVMVFGKPAEKGKIKEIKDDIFKMKVKLLSGRVVYTQRVKLQDKFKTNLTGTVQYLVCDDKQCLPPAKKTFSIAL